jgi:hypothetical protein
MIRDQFVNVSGRIVAPERGMAIPVIKRGCKCIADHAEADRGTPAMLPSMPSGKNVILLPKSAISS